MSFLDCRSLGNGEGRCAARLAVFQIVFRCNWDKVHKTFIHYPEHLEVSYFNGVYIK